MSKILVWGGWDGGWGWGQICLNCVTWLINVPLGQLSAMVENLSLLIPFSECFSLRSTQRSSSSIGRLLADLAEVDRGTDLLWNLLAGLLGHLLAFLPGNTHTPLLRHLKTANIIRFAAQRSKKYFKIPENNLVFSSSRGTVDYFWVFCAISDIPMFLMKYYNY